MASAAAARPAAQGFDVLAAYLDEYFYNNLTGRKPAEPKAPPKATATPKATPKAKATAKAKGPGDGPASTAFKRLKTNFTEPIRSANKQTDASQTSDLATPSASSTSAAAPAVTPSASVSSRTLRSSTGSLSRSSSLSDPPAGGGSLSASPNVIPSNYAHIGNERLDACPVPMSVANVGMRRIKVPELLRMDVNDALTVAIPPADALENKHAVKQRNLMMAKFRSAILAATAGTASMTASEKENVFQHDLSLREFRRDGRVHHEFNVRINNYAERGDLKGKTVSHSIAKSYAEAGCGIQVEIIGYGTVKTPLIKFEYMPYLEFFLPREPDAQFVDPALTFPRSKKEETIASFLVNELNASKGDAVAYVTILMNYYSVCYKNEKKKLATALAGTAASGNDRSEIDIDTIVTESLQEELSGDSIRQFAEMVDKDYLTEMKRVNSEWSEATSFLVHPSRINHYYSELEKRFPHCHKVFATIVSSKHYKVPINSSIPNLKEAPSKKKRKRSQSAEQEELPPPTDQMQAAALLEMDDVELEVELDAKKRKILFIFLALIRTKSQLLLTHWAQVEPLGYHYKGVQQPDKRSIISGSFSSHLKTCWKEQDKIYKDSYPLFQSLLREEMICGGCFDNWQVVLPKKEQNSKAAIVHEGTALALIQNRPFQLPALTRMLSPSGIVFIVVLCIERSDLKYEIRGLIVEQVSPQLTDDLPAERLEQIRSERTLIRGGFLWPKVGWQVVHMPGFAPRPSRSYSAQDVPSPLMAWVESDRSDASIIFERDRKFRMPHSPGAEVLSSKRYVRLVKMSRRMTDFRTQSNLLKKMRSDAKTAHDAFLAGENEPDSEPPPTIEYDSKTLAFMQLVDDASSEIDCAAKFQKEAVKIINPKAGLVNKMYAFELIPYQETSHSGMRMVYALMAEKCQLFKTVMNADNDTLVKTELIPNATHRTINLCVDGLSSKNFRWLEYELTRKLTEMGQFRVIDPMLKAFKKCFTCQNDYLHEILFHMQECIFKGRYGCFLQPIQVHLGWKRVNGEPSKKNPQGHENFLKVEHRALHRHMMNQFLLSLPENFFEASATDSLQNRLVSLKAAFESFFTRHLEGKDAPTRVAALHVKEMESYWRCRKGVGIQDFWLLEFEVCLWVTVYFMCKKSNYVIEACHRMDTLYGEQMSDFNLEWLRRNRFFCMTPGKGMPPDQLNEFVNQWIKGCVPCESFTERCSRSRHIMLMRECSYEAFGKRKRYSREKTGTSQEASVQKLVTLFKRANLFPVDTLVQRAWDKNFFWNLIEKPVAVGSKRDAAKEEVARTKAEQQLFDRLCKTDSERNADYDDFEEPPDDDDLVSVVSSCVGDGEAGAVELEDVEGPASEEDWENLNEDERKEQIDETLKKLGNIKKKPCGPNLDKDMLGDEKTRKKVQAAHEKRLLKQKRKFEMVYVAVNNFEQKMKRRRALLAENTRKSGLKQYERKSYWWRDGHKAEKAKLRKKRRMELNNV